MVALPRALVLALGLSACEPGHYYPTISFRCDPRTGRCPGHHVCCSDDPAARNGALPAYRDDIPRSDVPLFSAANNARSSTGMCVNLDHVPCDISLGEPEGQGGCTFPNCPIPCNPTWSTEDVALVCGQDLSCCQTVALEPDDCLLVDDVWRPATGKDVPQHTSWASSEHATHQDPGGRACSELTGSTSLSDPEFRSCIDQLTVANQRGFCMPSCPVPNPPDPLTCARLRE
jgi:hypothetical protein